MNIEKDRFEVRIGNALDVLKKMEDNSVNCIVTSPPYYGLRDYETGKWEGGDPNCKHYRLSKRRDHNITGQAAIFEHGIGIGDGIYKKVCPLCGAVRVDKQIGLEETPEEYVDRLVEVFRECKRVLTEDGTFWLNIGDSYAGSGKGRNGDGSAAVKDGSINSTSMGTINGTLFRSGDGDAKPKDLIGIPWLLAFALRSDGWYLRQEIIWCKPNPMPESVRDRCTKSHESIFLLTKNPHYYFDFEAIQEKAVQGDDRLRNRNSERPNDTNDYEYRRKRDVWTVAIEPLKEAHFATYPTKLIEPCILAGCPKDGIVMDPFCGSGTTGIVSMKHERKFIGIELNPKFAEMSERRIRKERDNGIQTSFF